MNQQLRFLVVTIVHNPQDARILHREIAAIRGAGHQVTYAAPFSAYESTSPDGLRTIDLPRAAGRRRFRAVKAARAMLRAEAPTHDLVLLHDPELLISVRGITGVPVVWDVHEDTAAAVTLKPWLPKFLRRPVALAFRAVERRVERRHHLLLAEDGYLPRFARVHPVVPNSTVVPADVMPSGADRVVYVGALTRARGVFDLIEAGQLLVGSGVTLEIVGGANGEIGEALAVANVAGYVKWHGFLPNDVALRLVSGALAGLSLLHDEANYRHSRPTKVIEYMAHGVAVITTPTPPARDLVNAAQCGIVVPFEDPLAVAAAVRSLALDSAAVAQFARNGHAAARQSFDWTKDGTDFVAILEGWVSDSRR